MGRESVTLQAEGADPELAADVNLAGTMSSISNRLGNVKL